MGLTSWLSRSVAAQSGRERGKGEGNKVPGQERCVQLGGGAFPRGSRNHPRPWAWAAQCSPYSPRPRHSSADLEPYRAQRRWQTLRPAAAGHILATFLQPLGWVPTLSRGGNKPCLPHSLLFLENSWQTELSQYGMSPT